MYKLSYTIVLVITCYVLSAPTVIPINNPTQIDISSNQNTDFTVSIPPDFRIVSTISPAGAYEVYQRIQEQPTDRLYDAKLEKQGLMLSSVMEPSVSQRLFKYRIYSKVDGSASFTAVAKKVVPVVMEKDYISFPQLDDYTYILYSMASGNQYTVNITSQDPVELVTNFGDYPGLDVKSKIGSQMILNGVAPLGEYKLYIGVRKASECSSCGIVNIAIETESVPFTMGWFVWIFVGLGVLVIIGALFTMLLCTLACCGVIAAPFCCAWLISPDNLDKDVSPESPVSFHSSPGEAVIYSQPTVQYYSQEPLRYQSMYPSAYQTN